jgi:hypothetical protein
VSSQFYAKAALPLPLDGLVTLIKWLALLRTEPRPFGRPARSQSLYRLSYYLCFIKCHPLCLFFVLLTMRFDCERSLSGDVRIVPKHTQPLSTNLFQCKKKCMETCRQDSNEIVLYLTEEYYNDMGTKLHFFQINKAIVLHVYYLFWILLHSLSWDTLILYLHFLVQSSVSVQVKLWTLSSIFLFFVLGNLNRS